MKKIILILLLSLSFSGFSQIHDPVKWTTSVQKISDTEYDLIATATIQDQWHLYSQTVPDGGPIPTTFTFKSSKDYLKKGNTKEANGHTVNDKVFEMEIKYFDKKAEFKQRIKLKTKETFEVDATVEFMVCNDTNCLPPKEVDLVFSVN
ncbi:protein-disulfide reductase DsbD domain-containing protein [Hwangdonia sp.]|uniref:protein-disulfide reductase DsbD domain-containing protein n=1 Tax=Hwangdonia sp. TaxID=1883432 RepID=UPI003AB63AEB